MEVGNFWTDIAFDMQSCECGFICGVIVQLLCPRVDIGHVGCDMDDMSLAVRKPVLVSFRAGLTQTGLYNHKGWLET